MLKFILLFLPLLIILIIKKLSSRKEGILGKYTRPLIKAITNRLPVKVLCGPNGKPFLFRYHLLALTPDGPGLCIHHFVDSDPDRGFHDHPWMHALSFVLAGSYEEKLNPSLPNEKGRLVSTGNFNYLHGIKSRHRVMIADGEDGWTFFMFGKRRKGWGFYNIMENGELHYKPMTTEIKDNDGGWWKTASKGREVLHRWEKKTKDN
ncbi:hypothetical protein M0812_05417 [Anaeramoeba flamelloides]|uniref:Cysteine dioxygenase n=1 Tax=Anaeramoeba flamelloides TaxID=1746091 RepID=A0AAV8A8Z5_9EUKA|nr:hypothetical protein M0812_05417 [Anaeramoeba flamelloides]|eukprot:Anaeramoba_flamelloidesa820601_63.p1 GENE.a820601_63~~a820601_63.p1  ORF type:complete len:206 (+),score=23.95 a820601_63:27-644(+)